VIFHPGSMEKEAKTLPKITINKIIKESLPDEVKCTADSQQLILQCCMEFLQLVSSEANEICSRQNKKVIVPEHILVALRKLGFDKYIPDLKQVHEEHKRQEAAKPKVSKRLEDSGLSREELLSKQKALFAKAKSAMSKQQEPQDPSSTPPNPPLPEAGDSPSSPPPTTVRTNVAVMTSNTPRGGESSGLSPVCTTLPSLASTFSSAGTGSSTSTRPLARSAGSFFMANQFETKEPQGGAQRMPCLARVEGGQPVVRAGWGQEQFQERRDFN